MKELLNEALQHLEEIENLKEKLEDIEDSLMGRELIYQGNYASVMWVSSNFQHVSLYIENEDGKNWEESLSVEELLELF